MTSPLTNIENSAELISYLHEANLLGRQERPETEVLRGGVSNRTVLLTRAVEDGASWVVKQALPKLRVEADWFCDPQRVQIEALGLQRLAVLLPPGSVPEYIYEDRKQHLLVMQAVEQPHINWKTQLLDGRIEPDYVVQFGTMLGRIHRGSIERSAEFSAEFSDRSIFETLRLQPYYVHTAKQVFEASDFLRSLVDQTRQRQVALVHGDYSPKNVLVHAGRLVLLDHEVLHWGDPAFDVGFSMTHFLSKTHFLPASREQFTNAARLYWKSYCDSVADGEWQQLHEQPAVHHTLACLLARVAGKSPLEYFRPNEREKQKQVVCNLLNRVPSSVDDLITEFVAGIELRVES